MHFARTKKVVVYGRRAQRFVAVTEDRQLEDGKTFSGTKVTEDRGIFIDCAHPKFSDDVYDYPLHPSLFKTTASKKLSDASTSSKTYKSFNSRSNVKGTPVRRPLGAYATNVPNSPAMPPKRLKPRPMIGRGTPARNPKLSAISPYIDVDIIVIDDSGCRLSTERRVSKTNVQVNDVDLEVHKTRKIPRREVKRAAARQALSKTSAIYASSDDNDDDDGEYVPIAKATKGGRGELEKKSRPIASSRVTESTDITKRISGSPENDVRPLRLPRVSKKAIRPIVVSDTDSDLAPGSPFVSRTETKSATTLIPTRSTGGAIRGVSAIDNIREPRKGQRLKREVEVVVPTPRISSSSAEASYSSLAEQDDTSRMKSQVLHPGRSLHLAHQLIEHSIKPDIPPFLRPRQLTPIRPPRSIPAFLQRPNKSSMSPSIAVSNTDGNISLNLSIDEELELALKVAEMNLTDSPQPFNRDLQQCFSQPPVPTLSVTTSRQTMYASASPGLPERKQTPAYLRPLLSECGQIEPFDFTSFIEAFPFDTILDFSEHAGFQELSSGKTYPSFQKVGEASYSEVFGIGNVVLKVIPLLEEDAQTTSLSLDSDLPPASAAKDVLKEIIVTKAMGEICKGFIRLLKTYVVQGAYPLSLLSLWDAYNNKKGSESVRPDSFGVSQLFAIIILPNGGPDLEAFSFSASTISGGSGWRQACSVFWQVARSLACAEELVNFEHRDLHWGQILVRHSHKIPYPVQADKISLLPMDDPLHGVQTTIIDLGLSRIDRGHADMYWTPFTEEIFESEGDYQYDVYRMMRKHNGGNWATFKPLTNVMWLHYLADKLLNCKRIRPPVLNTTVRPARKGTHVDRTVLIGEADKRAYDCLVDVEKALGLAIASIARSVGARAKRRTKNMKTQSTPSFTADSVELSSAVDVVSMGKWLGWIS